MNRLVFIVLILHGLITASDGGQKSEVVEAYLDVTSFYLKNIQNSSVLSSHSAVSNVSMLDSPKFQEHMITQVMMQELYCRRTYHMTGKQKEQLLSSSYQDIVFNLLRLDYLSNDQIWSLWQEYKRKHTCNVLLHRRKCEQQLQDAFVRRKQEQQQVQAQHQKLQQKQAALLKQYNPAILYPQNYVSCYHQAREQALQQTIHDHGKQHIKTYNFDPQTHAFLNMHGIDHYQFQNLSGTIFSHQLFQECVDHYKKASQVVFEHGLTQSALIPLVVECVHVAFQGTKYENFALAIQLSNLAEILSNVSIGVCKGVIAKTCNLIDFVRDPKRLLVAVQHAVGSLTKALHVLGGALVAYDQEGAVGITHLKAAQQAFGSDMILFNQMCEASKQYFKTWCQTSSIQDKAQAASELIFDCTITPLVLGKALKVCGSVLLQAKAAVKFASTIELAQELGLGFHEAEELLLATEVGIQKLPITTPEIETVMTNLLESEVNIALEGLQVSTVNNLLPFVEEFKNMGGVIPLKNKVFKNQFKKVLKQLEKELQGPMLGHIEKLYGKKIIGNKEVRVRLGHICNFELGLKESKKAGGYILEIGGGHLFGVCEALEEVGLIEIIGKNKLCNGVINYIMKDMFAGNFIYKTVLPELWNVEKIGNIIWDVFETGTDIITQKNFFKHKIVEGVDISLYIRNFTQQNNTLDLIEIVTLLPYKISAKTI